MTVFEKGGPQNTDAALKIALEKAQELGCDIVGATTGGDSAVQMLRLAGEAGFTGKLVFVTHCYGSRKPGENPMTDENRAILESGNCKLVTATHLLSGAERGLSNIYKGVYPVELIAAALRMLSAGVKVCVECSSMALDNGAIGYGKPIIAYGGTGRGADTVMLLSPAHGNNILGTSIHEIYCMPY